MGSEMCIRDRLRLVEKELHTNLGMGNTIFVGSSTDMWADEVPDEWILKVLEHCSKYPDNTYLFQSKNPKRFVSFISKFPNNIILGTTIETNRCYHSISNAPIPLHRKNWIEILSHSYEYCVMVSIEPIMDFDLDEFVLWLERINPKFVSIGADSKGNNLPEPPAWKVEELIKELRKFTEVKLKKNLNRILEVEENEGYNSKRA